METELEDQLQALARALAPSAPRPEPEPARPAVPRDIGAVAKRSAFAPDPVRQRAYYDLRHQPESRGFGPPSAPTGDAGPVAGLPRRRWPPVGEAAPFDPAVHDAPVPARPARLRSQPREGAAHGHGLDARTLSVAALVGVGVGLLGLTVMSQFLPRDRELTVAAIAPMSAPVQAPAPGTGESIVAASPGSAANASARPAAPTKAQERIATAAPDLPARIEAEGRTDARVVEVPPQVKDVPVEVAAPAVPEAAASARTAATTGRAPAPVPPDAFDAGSEVLAYAPVVRPSFPPRSSRAETGPAEEQGPGSARVTTSVNMRASPDNDASVVAVLAAGTTVKIEGCDFWCTVVANGKRGYVYRKFVGR